MTEGQQHTFLIRLSNEGLALNPQRILSFGSTNLPHGTFRFRPGSVLFWRAAIVRYDKSAQRVLVDIDSYQPDDVTAFFTQEPKAPIAFIEFTGISWHALLPYLSSYRKSAFEHLIIPDPEAIDQPGIVHRSANWFESNQNRAISLDFSIPFSKVRFVTGGALITRRVDTHQVEFLIPNSFILKEFDLLKEYFAKAIGKTKISVHATVTITAGKIENAMAASKEIDQIDAQLLDAVRYLEAKSARHTVPPNIDKELFSAEDLYARNLDDPQQQSGLQLLELLIRDETIRNRAHIQYLAGQLHVPGEKILFTAHPQFGFIFHINGQSHRHFIWELLNSHATYIWTYDPASVSPALALRRLEYALSAIRTQGRQTYRFEMLNNHGIDALHFHAIKHEKVSSAIVDSFPLWRAQLQQRLI